MDMVSEVSKIPQIDVDKNNIDELDRNAPERFIPIRGENINPEDVKYVCIRVLDLAVKKVYRMFAVKDFAAADGTQVKAREVGGIVDIKSFIEHRDGSWLSEDSVALSSVIKENSVVKNESKLWRSSVETSTLDKCDLQSTKVKNSVMEHSIAFDCCSVTNSKVSNSILKDRAHVEDSTIADSNLNFCWVSDSNLKLRDVIGNVSKVQQAKLHKFNSEDGDIKESIKYDKKSLWQMFIGKNFGR